MQDINLDTCLAYYADMKNRPTDIVLDNNSPFSNEEALSIILNNLDEIVVLVNKQLQIIHITERTRENVSKIWGININSETSILELVAKDRWPMMLQLYEDVFSGNERETVVEFPVFDLPAIFETHFKPAKNSRGEIIGAVIIAKDVTAKKKAENYLKQAEERWRFAIEGAHQGVWDWNVQTGDIFFSDSYKKLYGYAPGDLKGRIEEWEDIIHPDDKDQMSKAIEQHMASNEPYYESTYRVKTKSGNYKWILGKGMLIRNEEGVAVRMLGTHTDITEQIVIKQELQKSNERFLFVSRATSDAIYDWNVHTNEVYWGEGLQTLFGFNPKELTIPVWEKLIHTDDQKRVKESCRSAIQNPDTKLWNEEYRFAKADGSYSYVLDRGFIIRDEKQLAIRMIGSLQDITERKYSEQILSLERTVFELSNKTNVDVKQLVETLLKGFEKIHEDAFSSLLLLKEDNTAELFVAPRLPAEYTSKLEGIEIGPELGSCGAAMWTKQTIIADDINCHPYWEKFKALALQFGLESCWSLPIIHTSGNVMGSFAVYYKKIKSPSSIELNTLERVRNIIRILMEYHWSLKEIKKANEQFDIIMKATHDLIWDWDLQTNTVSRSALGLEKVYGMKDNKPIEKIEQWLMHVHPDDSKKIEKIISKILEGIGENIFEVEYRFKRDDGTYAYVYDRGMIIRNSEGKPVRLLGAAQNITERKHLEEELLQTELEKQKAINQATIDSQEQERSEIGKELHDNVNQILTTTKLYLDLALTNTELKDDLIAKSNKNIISVINEIRQLSRSLMDPTLGDLGLLDSINDLIENINLTRKLHVSLAAEEKVETLLSKNYKLTVFRIIQEALNNAIKHAKATGVEIFFNIDAGNIKLVIKDDGIGFDATSVKLGAGLQNIQNRVYLVNGTYSIQTSPGKGCKITIEFPIIK